MEERNMLTCPSNGWTYFTLGRRKYPLSHGLESRTPFVFKGFCEPGRFMCVVSLWNSHILLERDEDSRSLEDGDVYREIVNVSMLDMCKALYSDISRDIDAWSLWQYSSRYTESERKNNVHAMKKRIEERLALLKFHIDKNAVYFSGNKSFFF